MTIDWITTPVSEDAPAGPDLLETDDGDFGDFYFDSVGRLPEPVDYFRPGMEIDNKKTPDQIFDPKSVKLDDEIKKIDTLLKRSRDLRLLTLRAQWAILAGDLNTCVDSVEAMALLLETFPNEAHPVIDGSPRDRLDAINDLQQIGAMILPLRYLDLANTGTSLRRMMVVRGEATAHDGEDDLDETAMLRALTSRGSALADLRDRLNGFAAALTRIETACLGHDVPHTPQIKTLSGEVAKIIALLGEADPSLTSSAPEATPAEPGETPEAAPAAEGTTVIVKPATDVKSHADARARLTAVEGYFQRYEPSSAALLLVLQSRLLIGKSLIDAFDTLMPSVSDQAKVSFRPEQGFRLAHNQLRELADMTASDRDDSDGTDDDTPPEPHNVSNASEAVTQIKAVETYFRTVEKSSPIPMLLARAQAYVGKDFETLMKEFIPKQD